MVAIVELNTVTAEIVDAAMKVHSALGPGLLESAYKTCLAFELRRRGLKVETEVAVPIVYDGIVIDVGYRMDLLVESQVVVELKAVSELIPIFKAQLLSHLKLADKRVGLLINFHVEKLKDGGILRMVNRFQDQTN